MKAVGLRELKNRLSEYVREVRRGRSVLVTDRGEVVAELGPPRPAASVLHPPALQELARAGLATLGAPNDASAYRVLRPALAPGRPAELLTAERGSR
jgi:antitoxin (DNA-binding transcriptional repressor) of toxin-antitoxin stability system